MTRATKKTSNREEKKDVRGIEIRLVIDFWKVSAILFMLLSAFLIVYYGVWSNHNVHQNNNAKCAYEQALSEQNVAQYMKDFIQNYILNGEGVVEVINVSDVSGLYRLDLQIGNKTGPVFATKDNKYLFIPITSQGNLYLQVIDTQQFKQLVEKLKQEGRYKSLTPRNNEGSITSRNTNTTIQR